MMVTFVSQCEKKSLAKTRRVLDAFANRIGSNTWQTVITNEGLQAVKQLLRETASKNTAVSCHWLRSRSRSELVWIVGNRSKFNAQGVVPVNYTSQNIATNSTEGDWSFLPTLEVLTVFSALLHDFGKLTKLFQDKLKGKNKTQRDPLRHEWISVLFLIAIVNGKRDEEWLDSLISDEVHQLMSKLTIQDVQNPLSKLPPIASMVAWLILTHHKLPVLEEGYKGEPVSLLELFRLISPTWGYSNSDVAIEFHDWVKYAELPSKSIEWQQEIKKCAIQLKNKLAQIHDIFKSSSLRPVMIYSRSCLVLADHYYSSQSKDKDWHSGVKLFANTDHHNQLKQQLDEHLVGVARQARANIRKLPDFEATFNQEMRVLNNAQISKKSPKAFKWQDAAVSALKKWKQEQNLDKHHFGFFAVNMASTGKGKTFSNAKIMQALSVNEESLRYVLALGLRTLTLQTGDEYRDKIGLKNDELAILIGSKAIIELHEQKNRTGSESSTSLLDNTLIFSKDFPEQGLDTVLKNEKDRRFLYAPVLACTIDHIIQATEVTQGGRHILPSMRLMSSDLVIDEVDDFDNTDLIAIGRLIHFAGMMGRKVMISSATIPPDLAEGYYHAYQSGWRIFAKSRSKEEAVGCAWVDEFGSKTFTVADKDEYQKKHHKFIDKRICNLEKQAVKRKVNIAPCSTEPSAYFEAIQQAVVEKHQHHHFIDHKTNKKISIGVVRMANIDPCVALTRHFLNCQYGQDVTIKAMAYHSRQVLLMRHEQERYLDRILKRDKGNAHILEDKVIRSHIDSASAQNIIFVLVATPVEEVGRDHDFDWAVIEPSSYRSFIQMAGRVLRHRDKEVIQPNIAIMKYNYRALKNKGKKVAFKWPGYQSNMNDLTTYDLEKLVDTEALAKALDATHRIKQTESSELAALEHQVMHLLLTNYEAKGPESMQGWIESDWWLTGLPQQYVRFRGSQSKDLLLFLNIENTFLEKGDRGTSVPTGNNNIDIYSLDEHEEQNLWFKRDYRNLLQQQADRSGLSTEDTALIYGEINIPTYGKPLANQKFFYNEQLGLTKGAACSAVK